MAAVLSAGKCDLVAQALLFQAEYLDSVTRYKPLIGFRKPMASRASFDTWGRAMQDEENPTGLE